MRRKNAVTVKTKQGELKLDGKTVREKWASFRYGRNYDPDALKAIQALRVAALMDGGPPRVDKIIFDQHRDKFFAYVAENYKKSWALCDGTFFHKLADAMQNYIKPVSPAQSAIGDLIIFRREQGLPMPSIIEALDLCRCYRIPVVRKTVDRILKKHYKITPSKDKSGRKLGTKQKTGYSAGRN